MQIFYLRGRETETEWMLMELLSPAGNLELALAAFDGGADAIYCGMSRFNARERAENFTPETMGKAIRYAHEHGRKVYVTLNTLIKEGELPELFTVLCQLDKLAPDALIVQDLGVAAVVREYFPHLTLHASTQMGIHNSAGVAAAAQLGFKRVILERQVTPEELKLIAGASPLELEVFIHGSLCCSLSGRCLLSSYLGNWSGNRGKCKQPCRREYFCDRGEKGFLLSPKDLRGLSLLKELAGMGIASLKIEGRLRSPDYVWKSARAYRTVLDASESDMPQALAEAEKLLDSTAAREGGSGFYFAPAFAGGVIAAKRIGAFGNMVAKVERCGRSGMNVTALNTLHLGDRLRITPPDGGEGESFSLISMYRTARSGGDKILRAGKNDKLFIPGEFTVKPGDLLYKIGENGFDFSRQANSLPEKRFPLPLKLTVSAAAVTAELRCGEKVVHWQESTAFAPAQKCAAAPESVAAVFSAGVPEPWEVEVTAVTLDDGLFIPAAELKALRRRFWMAAAPQLDENSRFAYQAEAMEKFYRQQSPVRENPVLPELTEEVPPLIPAFVPETALPVVRRNLQNAVAAGVEKVYISGLHAFALLQEFPQLEKIVRFPLPVTNSCAVKVLRQLGAAAVEAEPELENAAVTALAQHSPLPVHAPAADPPLLATRVKLPVGSWQDRRGNSFVLRREGELSLLCAADGKARRHFVDAELK